MKLMGATPLAAQISQPDSLPGIEMPVDMQSVEGRRHLLLPRHTFDHRKLGSQWTGGDDEPGACGQSQSAHLQEIACHPN